MGCKAVVVCQCRVEWLSRWLLMAHWRCTKAFDLSFLSASLPCARLSTLSILVSASRVSLALSRSIFLLPGAALRRVIAARCSSSSLFLSFSRTTNTHVYTRAHQVPLHRPFPLFRLSIPVSFPRRALLRLPLHTLLPSATNPPPLLEPQPAADSSVQPATTCIHRPTKPPRLSQR